MILVPHLCKVFFLKEFEDFFLIYLNNTFLDFGKDVILQPLSLDTWLVILGSAWKK